jgi:DNA-binding CsgD family transcriptional regulator
MPEQLIEEINGQLQKIHGPYPTVHGRPGQRNFQDSQHIEERDIDGNHGYASEQSDHDSIRYYLGGHIRTAGGTEGVLGLAFREDEGHAKSEHIKRLSVLLPHIRRAIEIGQQLGIWRNLADVNLEIMNRLTHGVVLLDARQRVMSVNLCAERILGRPSPLCIREGVLFAHDHGVHRELQSLICQSVASSRASGSFNGGMITMRFHQGSTVIHVVVSPIQITNGTQEVCPPAAAVFLHDPTAMQLDQQAMRQGFGLTIAESRLAALLIDGRSLQESSVELGVTLHTVRSQLKCIFAKTGVNGQTDLLRILLPLCKPPL